MAKKIYLKNYNLYDGLKTFRIIYSKKKHLDFVFSFVTSIFLTIYNNKLKCQFTKRKKNYKHKSQSLVKQNKHECLKYGNRRSKNALF